MKIKVHAPMIALSALLWLSVVDAEADEWVCSVHFESQCAESSCSSRGHKDDGNVKPVSARFDDEGGFLICMYSGCYEGQGRVLTTEPFLSIVKERVRWTGTNPDETGVFIVLERNDLIGMFKASSFVQPIVCETVEDED